MKITQTIGIASALLLVAGCAHEEYSARTDESVSPSYGHSSGRTEDNTHHNVVPSPPSGGGYSGSASGTYSTGNGGTYSVGVSTGGQSQSDNTIVAQVRAALERDPEIAFVVPNIQISANNGAIILNGHVQSEEQKRQILSRVQQVTGVATVNNQLEIMPGSNGSGSSSSGSQMNPTGGSSGADRLYKDASNGPDQSTNNALNPTSRENAASQLYRESDQNNSSTNAVNSTSRENGNSQIYQGNPGENSNTNNNPQ